MKPIGIHVIGEAARTTDSRDEHDLFLGHAKLGKYLLYLGKD
jgi:hypothetical protein